MFANLLYKSRVYRALRPFWRGSLVVFNYHRIRAAKEMATDFDEGVFGPTLEKFCEQMRWLKKNAEVISQDDLLANVRSGRSLPDASVMVTFDDGYRDTIELALPVLKVEKIPAIFFIPTKAIEHQELGWWDLIAYLVKKSKRSNVTILGHEFNLVGESAAETASRRAHAICRLHEWMRKLKTSETRFLIQDLSAACDVSLPEARVRERELMSWDQVREAQAAGIAIGSHTHTHRVLSTLSEKEQKNELLVSKTILERELGRPVVSIAYPVGGNEDFRLESDALPKKFGYELGFSFQTGFNRVNSLSPFKIRRISAAESIPLFCAAITIPPVFAVP